MKMHHLLWIAIIGLIAWMWYENYGPGATAGP